MKLIDLNPGDKVRYRRKPEDVYEVVEVWAKKGAYARIRNVHGHEVKVQGVDLWRYTESQTPEYYTVGKYKRLWDD